MIDVNNNRYFPPLALLDALKKKGLMERLVVEGYSNEKRPIYSLELGQGTHKVLAWSQMHGNETTTTKALLDVLDHLLLSVEGKKLLQQLQLKLIFQLSPDGALNYTRLNGVGVDLNRDASTQSQPEMQTLIKVFKDFSPNLCLNLHGQRTIFAAGKTNTPSALSFLAPAADSERSITPAREMAMKLIAAMASEHETSTSWGIGRYDDSFNINCTGDYFIVQGVPTILFEAGHYPNDYARKTTRTLVTKSIIDCLNSFCRAGYDSYTIQDYHAIPENSNHLRDIEFTEVTIVNNGNITKSSLFVQFKEVLKQGVVEFVPEFSGNDCKLSGLVKIKMPSSQENSPINLTKSAVEIMESLTKYLNV